MKKTIKNLSRSKFLTRGDTLVEVLIAIAVAAFAIGTSYAIANKSLQRAVAARERNEALNYIEGQITALKIRYKADSKAFNNSVNGFVVDPASGSVGTKSHFCLDEASKSANDTLDPWTPQVNNVNDTQAATLTVGNPGYNANCKRTTGTTDYYIDVSTLITPSSQSLNNKTVYRIIVRWSQLGGDLGQSIIYYRVGGNTGSTLGAAVGNPLPPPGGCNNLPAPITLLDTLNNFYIYYRAERGPAGSPETYVFPLAQPLPAGCSYTFSVSPGDPAHGGPAQQPQDHEQMFIEGCSNSDPAGCDSTINNINNISANPVFRTGETPDVPDNVPSLNPPATFTVGPLSKQVDYLLFKHCSIDHWNNQAVFPAACRIPFDGESINSLTISY